MTLESSFPIVSVVAAVAAGVVIGRPAPRAIRALKVCAIAALALFAYFRQIAPTEIPVALVLGAIAEVVTPAAARRWAVVDTMFRAAGWVVFAYLFLRIGEGRAAFLGDAVKAAMLVGLLVGAGFGLARLWPLLGRSRRPVGLEAAALSMMVIAALTLYWSFWPAMAGAAGVMASEGLMIAAVFTGRPADSLQVRRGAWALSYLGQAAMAYAFLR